MNIARNIGRLVLAAIGIALIAAFPAAGASASTSSGWIRLAHLSPNTPPVDVYLYSFGNPTAWLVVHHVSYGTVSSYEAVAAGEYSVAMRPAGAAAATKPVISASVDVVAGNAYTVAGLGPESGLRLQVLHDDLRTPSGKALVRVIQASLREHVVTVTYGGEALAASLEFGSVSPYRTVSPATAPVRVAANGADANSEVTLAAGSVHTMVVLDGSGGLRIDSLLDAAGSDVAPAGAAATGLGGTAPGGQPSALPWVALLAAGALLALAGGLGLRRPRVRYRGVRRLPRT